MKKAMNIEEILDVLEFDEEEREIFYKSIELVKSSIQDNRNIPESEINSLLRGVFEDEI